MDLKDSLSADDPDNSNCALCGKNIVIWKPEVQIRDYYNVRNSDNNVSSQQIESGSDCNPIMVCLLCRSGLNDLKNLHRKFEKLENKVELLNNRISFLSSANEFSSNYKNNIYRRRSTFVSSIDINSEIKLVRRINCVKRLKKFIISRVKNDQKTQTRDGSISSEAIPPFCIENNNQVSLSSNNKKVEIRKRETVNDLEINYMSEMVREFCETTTFHGFPEWYRAPNWTQKILWVIIIILGCIGTSYEIFTVINDYRNAPTSTSYEFSSPINGMVFPEITLCNTNFLNASRAKALNYSNAVVNAAKFLIMNSIEDVIGSVFDPLNTYLNKNLEQSDIAASKIFMPDILEDLQYNQNEFIKACFFEQQPCTTINISIQEAPDAEYGVCFMISLNSLQTKSGEGLQLILDTHSDLWWTDQPTFGHGVVVRIEKTHNPGVLRSYFVMPNHLTKISLSAIHYEMLDAGECRNDMMRKIFNSNLTYSEDLCRMECYFPVVLKHCSCIRPMPPEYLLQADLRQCFNSTQQNCLKDALLLEKKDSEAQECLRQCLPPCDSWDYRTSISMMKFPALPVIPVMEEMYNKSANESRFNDFVVLDIAFDQLRVTNIKQQVSITPDGFLSQIGGHLGLFLGASLMSVVQIFVVCIQWSFRYFTQKFAI